MPVRSSYFAKTFQKRKNVLKEKDSQFTQRIRNLCEIGSRYRYIQCIDIALRTNETLKQAIGAQIHGVLYRENCICWNKEVNLRSYNGKSVFVIVSLLAVKNKRKEIVKSQSLKFFLQTDYLLLSGNQPTPGLGTVSPNLRCLLCKHPHLSQPTGSPSMKWRGTKPHVIQPMHLVYMSTSGYSELCPRNAHFSLPVRTLREGDRLKDRHMKSDKSH